MTIRSILLPAIAATALLAGCTPGGSPANAATSAPAGPPGRGRAVPRVETVPAQPEALPQRIPAVGSVFAAEETVVSSKVAGILVRTAVDVGQVVAPGDVLAGIETANYEFSLREAQAALDETLAQMGVTAVPGPEFDIESLPPVRRAAAELDAARFTHDRLVQMRGTGSDRVVADQELSNARRDLAVAEAELAAARDSAKALMAIARQREASLAVAKRRLADAMLKAPPIPSTLAALRAMSGLTASPASSAAVDRWVVVDRLATEGQYINVATPLYRLIVNDFVLLRAEVSQRYAGRVAVGLAVEIELPEGPRPVGHVCRIRPAIDPLSRTYGLDVLVDNRELRGESELAALKPGAFAKLTITTSHVDEVVWLPSRAIRTLAGVSTVFVLNPSENRVRAREVSVLRRQGGRVAVQGAIQAGELLVVAGAEGLVDGAAVTRGDGQGAGGR